MENHSRGQVEKDNREPAEDSTAVLFALLHDLVNMG